MQCHHNQEFRTRGEDNAELIKLKGVDIRQLNIFPQKICKFPKSTLEHCQTTDRDHAVEETSARSKTPKR